jgi:hypothetical protein
MNTRVLVRLSKKNTCIPLVDPPQTAGQRKPDKEE